MSIFDAVMTKI